MLKPSNLIERVDAVKENANNLVGRIKHLNGYAGITDPHNIIVGCDGMTISSVVQYTMNVKGYPFSNTRLDTVRQDIGISLAKVFRGD